MFSSNESYDEIPPNDIKFLLLPYFLAQLTLKLTTTNGPARKNAVEVAEVYYKDFLNRCSEYGLRERKEDELRVAAVRNPNELEELKEMAVQRNDKLRRFREKKELEEKVQQMKVAVEREAELDDSTLRQFYDHLIRLSIMEAEEETKFLEQERKILDFGGQMREEAHDKKAHHHHQPRPLKPIIITRDAVQKAIYGNGYPSLPTMTVEEFYHQRVADGIFPDPCNPQPTVKARQDMTEDEVAELDEQEQVAIEHQIEQDDEMFRARQQAMDEFKDVTRRGDGNRHNRS